ncbi:AraC family transcriptional regulator [Methylophaga sp.]|uniref:AraC family transcriptional regulator n=1 Tax=Methylophaga sp. TaxID=2024840 RepID=UPI003A91D259
MKAYQSERVNSLISYIDTHLNESFNAQKIERICNYSYRNINRLFLATQGETIGKHILRRRLEKSGEYLRFSSYPVSDIADALGFNNLAAFSKAFKAHFSCAPSQFRATRGIRAASPHVVSKTTDTNLSHFSPSIETLPAFNYLYFQYQGDYTDSAAIEQLWIKFLSFCDTQNLIDENSIFFGAILDDNEICEAQFCRYRACLISDEVIAAPRLNYATYAEQTYARFLHDEQHYSSAQFYQQIYSNWANTTQRELADLPTLEFYQDTDNTYLQNQTEIYIPIL